MDSKTNHKRKDLDRSGVEVKHHLTIKDVRRMARKPNLFRVNDVRIGSTTEHLIRQSIVDNPIQTSDQTMSCPSNADKESIRQSDKELDQIICVYKRGQQIQHLIKWKGSNRCQVFDSHRANKLWPQVVIKFYERHLKFNDKSVEDRHQI